jgi:hypothetical protein
MFLNFIFGLAAWFQNLIGNLDEGTKRQIVELFIRSCEELFRHFYRNWKEQKEL